MFLKHDTENFVLLKSAVNSFLHISIIRKKIKKLNPSVRYKIFDNCNLENGPFFVLKQQSGYSN